MYAAEYRNPKLLGEKIPVLGIPKEAILDLSYFKLPAALNKRPSIIPTHFCAVP